ncbi:ATP-dependent protease La Type I [Moraxella catarrhalis]|nr:ATP-dependent protease La Type I [Moraxella catarrhalis]
MTIESATMQGKGELVFTGSLGDVMKESIRAAMSVVRANGERFGITYENLKIPICISTCLKVQPQKMAHRQVLP